MLRACLIVFALSVGQPLWAGFLQHGFPSIEGDWLDMSDWAGQPVLVVNTASQCGFTDQYADMQALYDRYRDQGLVVLAVPSNDFRQELDSAEEVQEFCELTYGINLPMADISRVTGPQAHPFYAAVRDETGFEPHWNFNKVLIGRDGQVQGTWWSRSNPLGREIVSAIEAELAK